MSYAINSYEIVIIWKNVTKSRGGLWIFTWEIWKFLCTRTLFACICSWCEGAAFPFECLHLHPQCTSCKRPLKHMILLENTLTCAARMIQDKSNLASSKSLKQPSKFLSCWMWKLNGFVPQGILIPNSRKERIATTQFRMNAHHTYK
jgi:hypothetical protein